MSTPPQDSRFALMQALSDVYILFHTDIEKMPKLLRYTLGVKMLETSYRLIELLTLALRKSGKSRLFILEKMDCELASLKIAVRILSKTKNISDGRYAFLSERLVGIGRQLGGFIKAEKENQSR